MIACTRHALVVDDEQPIRKLVAGALAEQGFVCDFASDGDEALASIARSRYDVVVTDLKMPHKHGHALVLDLLALESRPLIVIHTGVIEPKLANDLLYRGVDDILFKPTHFGFLATKVRTLVDRRAAIMPRADKLSDRPVVPSEAIAPEIAKVRSRRDPISLPTLNERLRDVASVLPISSSAMDVFNMTRGCDCEISRIAAAVQRDPSFTADVLRLANSAAYNPSNRQILELEESVLRIGQRRVGEMALAASALSAVAPGVLPWLDLNLTWKRSLAAGLVLESLIEIGGHQNVEEGLLLGAIMHPLGRVLMGMLFADEYSGMIEGCEVTGESLLEQERRVFPASHAEILGHLLDAWRIPASVCVPLKFSCDDFSSLIRLAEPTRTRAELLSVSIALGQLAVGEWQPFDLVQIPGPGLLKRLGVADVAGMLQQVRIDLSKLAGLRGDPAAERISLEPDDLEEVAYFNLSEGEPDAFAELLPALGIAPRESSSRDLRDADLTVIVNCIGAPPVQFSRSEGAENTLLVADAGAANRLARLGRTAALPNSFARLRATFADYLSARVTQSAIS